MMPPIASEVLAAGRTDDWPTASGSEERRSNKINASPVGVAIAVVSRGNNARPVHGTANDSFRYGALVVKTGVSSLPCTIHRAFD